MISGWYYPLLFLILFVILAYFYTINWVKDLRLENGGKRVLVNYLESRKRKIGKLPPVYPNGWFALIESWKVRKGEVKHVAALGENFAVFRTENGEINVLDAYCPHLGANMAEGGRVKGNCLECPFHGWLFRGNDGQCESVPYAERVPRVARVKTWSSCEINNMVFVWYHAEAIEPTWRLEPHPDVVNGKWWYHGRNEFIINCHVQEIAENGADFAHLSAVHGPFMFLERGARRLARHSWTNLSWNPDPSFLSEEKSANGHRAQMMLRHSLVLLSSFEVLELDVRVNQIGPGYVELLMETSFGPIGIFQTVTPIEPLVQRVTHTIYAAPLIRPYASLVFLGECLMFERDVAVWNRKKFMHQPLLVREDKTINLYRRWYAQFYSANSPTYRDSGHSIDW